MLSVVTAKIQEATHPITAFSQRNQVGHPHERLQVEHGRTIILKYNSTSREYVEKYFGNIPFDCCTIPTHALGIHKPIDVHYEGEATVQVDPLIARLIAHEVKAAEQFLSRTHDKMIGERSRTITDLMEQRDEWRDKYNNMTLWSLFKRRLTEWL